MFVTLSHLFVTAEECDDEDDPEYNFLADVDEPDVEDYRDDKAVRITSQSKGEEGCSSAGELTFALSGVPEVK